MYNNSRPRENVAEGGDNAAVTNSVGDRAETAGSVDVVAAESGQSIAKVILREKKSPDELAAEIARIVSGKKRVCSSEINRVFEAVFGPMPYDIHAISKTCFDILEDRGTQIGDHQRRILNFILAWMEISKNDLQEMSRDDTQNAFRDWLFYNLAPFAMSVSGFVEMEATDKEAAHQVLLIFSKMLGSPDELRQRAEKIQQEIRGKASEAGGSSGNSENGQGFGGASPKRPDLLKTRLSPPEQMPLQAVIDAVFSRENTFDEKRLLKTEIRKWTRKDYWGIVKLLITRPLQLEDIGCIKEKLLSGTVDNVDIDYFLKLIPQEQAASLNLVLTRDPQKGPKLIAELFCLLRDKPNILEIFRIAQLRDEGSNMKMSDIIEILDSMRPSILIPLFSKWFEEPPMLVNKYAVTIIEGISRRAGSYPFLYSLFEQRQNPDGTNGFVMRVTGEALDADLEKTAADGLKSMNLRQEF